MLETVNAGIVPEKQLSSVVPSNSNRFSPPPLKASYPQSVLPSVKVIPLGGVEEIGINSTAFEYGDDLFVVDMGLGFPMGDQYGIDYIIPNIDYILKSKKHFAGIVITHAHLDHIGALQFVLEDLGNPIIYASKFAAELINLNLAKNKPNLKARIRVVDTNSTLYLGKFQVNFFGVNHSIPESMGVIIRSPVGNIVHTGDFKFDNSPTFEPVAEYAKIAQVGSEGVLAMLSDSTNSFKSGHSKSETVIGNNLLDIVEGAKGRVIVSTFSSLVTRILQLIETAIATNRKVAIAGRSMENVIEICVRLGYLKKTAGLFIKTSELDKYSDNRLLILATGAQGEDMAALARIGRGEHKDVKIKKGDSVILSASIIPGNDMLVQNLIDDLSDQGAIVFHQAEEMTLHSSGHGYQEDQKIMLNLAKPKFFMPVHGYPSFLHKHAQTAVSVGMKEKDIIIAKRGEIISLTKTGWKKEGRVKATPVFVSGSGVGDIGNLVLEERQQLANYGVVAIAIELDWNGKKMKGKPHIVSRGFVYVKDNLDMIGRIEKETEKAVAELMAKNVNDTKQFKELIIERVAKILYAETEREPMILPIIIY